MTKLFNESECFVDNEVLIEVSVVEEVSIDRIVNVSISVSVLFTNTSSLLYVMRTLFDIVVVGRTIDVSLLELKLNYETAHISSHLTQIDLPGVNLVQTNHMCDN